MDYRTEVRRVSNMNRAFLPMFGKVELVLGPGNDGFQVDHIVPLWFGEHYELPRYEMSGVENLQIISSADNDARRKYGKGSLMPDAWFSLITGKQWVYSLSGSDFKSIYLYEVCLYAGVSYVKAASQLMKESAFEIKVGGEVIMRLDSSVADQE